VLEKIHGTGPGIIKGAMVYKEQEDMAGLGPARYHYSPYLLEALMHLFAFYAASGRRVDPRMCFLRAWRKCVSPAGPEWRALHTRSQAPLP